MRDKVGLALDYSVGTLTARSFLEKNSIHKVDTKVLTHF